MTTTVTKTAKVIAALESGVELTAKQIESRYNVANARAMISSLRMQGYPVYLNKRVSTYNGETYSKYRLGTPSRAVVAAGYQALAS
jgi:cell division septation protein DedD